MTTTPHTETDRIAAELRKSLNGPAWHGPALLELLRDVRAPLAARRPVAGTHSIWELVLHIATWLEIVRERLDGVHRDIPADEDWAAVRAQNEEAWQALVARVAESAGGLAARVEQFPDKALDQRLPGAAPAASSAYATLQGSVQHVLYHAGQIAILKKAT